MVFLILQYLKKCSQNVSIKNLAYQHSEPILWNYHGLKKKKNKKNTKDTFLEPYGFHSRENIVV